MAFDYKTPGVYIEEIPKFPPSIAQVETAIPAFIGYTEFATYKIADDLIGKPFRISSMADYRQYFGEGFKETSFKMTSDANDVVTVTQAPTKPAFFMYYALQMYFANGGGPCWIVSAGKYMDNGAPASANAVRYGPEAPADATNPGLKAGLDALAKVDEPTMILFPDGTALANDDYHTLLKDALAQCAKLMDRFLICDVRDGSGTVADAIDEGTNGFRTKIGTSNLSYGAVYYPNVRTILSYTVDTTKFSLNATDVNLITDVLGANKGRLYNNILKAIEDTKVVLPPGSLIAGVYANVDRTRGVWKAPANVSLNAVIEPTVIIDNDIQDGLNIHSTGKSVNAIRSFAGKGTLVWGARTLDGNSNEWRYLSVRRFFNMVEESVKKATEPFVFEPNDANTWVKVQAMIENYLNTLWRVGALQGAKPEHAYYVAVGLGKTMTALDILEGRMIVEIGMAVVRPAEFIILRFSHKMAES